MEENVQKQLVKLIGLIDRLSISTNKIGVSFHGKKGSEIRLKGFVYLDLMQRINANLEGLLLMLKNLEKSPELKSSIALLLRACLEDILTGYYLYTYLKDETTFENEVNVLGLDYMNYVFTMIEEEPIFNPFKPTKEEIQKDILEKKKDVCTKYQVLIKSFNEETEELEKYSRFELRKTSSSELFPTDSDKKVPISAKNSYKRLRRFEILHNHSYVYVLMRFFAQFQHYAYFNREILKLDMLANFAFVVQSFHQITEAILTFGGLIETDSKLLKNVEDLVPEFVEFYGLTKGE